MAVSKVNEVYTKPAGGIPDSDIASAANWNKVSVNTANDLQKIKFSRGNTGNVFLDFYVSSNHYYRLGFFKTSARIFLEDHDGSTNTQLWVGVLSAP